MASGNSTQQNLRKAIGALKDSTKVGIAIVNSEYKELDVAIVKATNHDEMLPKQKHMRTIFNSVCGSSPRADVAYCIHTLARRLAKTRTWTVALKVLVVIHRALREVDPTFREELTNYNFSRVHILNLSHFKDESSPSAWDYSAWVRAYSLYLEELLECSRRLKYDFQKHRSRIKRLDTPDLLEQLPVLQQLLLRLLACQPEGAARYNFLIQYALSLVANESIGLYVIITDGVVNLVDKFFEMQRHDAIRALEIYKKATRQAERLSEFYEKCETLQFGTPKKYIKIEQAPASFLTAMEEYVKDAPQTLMLPWNASDDEKVLSPKEISARTTLLDIDNGLDTDVSQDLSVASEDVQKNRDSEIIAAVPPLIDLLSLDDVSQEVPQLEDTNALALATIVPEDYSASATSLDPTSQSTGWELALVENQSSNTVAISGSTLGGGLDRSILDSLYDVALAKTTDPNEIFHIGKTSSNPFEDDDYTQEPYALSTIQPHTGLQMVAIPQEPYALSTIQPQTGLQMVVIPQEPYASGSIQPQNGLQLVGIPQEQDYTQQQEQFMQVGNDPTNPFDGNPFMDQANLPHPSSQDNFPHPSSQDNLSHPLSEDSLFHPSSQDNLSLPSSQDTLSHPSSYPSYQDSLI